MSEKVSKKSIDDICNEWNNICESRQKIIEQGKDISLISVTTPCILKHLKNEVDSNVLDIGCGTGYLTHEVSKHCKFCIGIDISDKSILLAKSLYTKQNLKFINCAIDDFVPTIEFNICISNMVAMTDPDWMNSVKKIYNLLTPRGKLFIMITHPYFWSKYWGYDNNEWFNYNEEIYIENNFSTSLVKNIGTTTHIHRPLSQYINGITAAGFEITELEEPYPICETPDEYDYKYPRFLFIKCCKK